MHREHLSPIAARLAIALEGIRAANASRAAFDGPLTPRNLSPVPKNPVIANFFLQVGLAEELGSRLRSLYQCSKPFMGADPVVVEGDVFTALIPDARSLQDGSHAANPVDAAIADLLEASSEARSADVAETAGVSQPTASAHLAKMVGRARSSPGREHELPPLRSGTSRQALTRTTPADSIHHRVTPPPQHPSAERG